MKIKYNYSQKIRNFTTLIILTFTSSIIEAQDTTEKKEIAPDNSELLQKGNTWTYNVSLQVPDDSGAEITLKTKGEKTKTGMIYEYEKILQSTGLGVVKGMNRKMPLINIFIEGELKQKQILEYREGALLYYGTYLHDPTNPDSQKGIITQKPIMMHNSQATLADKWGWTTSGLENFQFRIVAKNVEIIVQGTKYMTDKIQMDQVKKDSTQIIQSKEIWFSNKFGVVKEKEKNYLSNGTAIIKTLKLKKFTNKE